MRSVDLNCDCGEGFGAYRIGDDAAMLDIVTSVNVACGFHAGDPEIMAKTFAAAKAKGVAAGAHPGFPDLFGFGRRKMPFTAGEIERLVAYQIGAANALATYAGARLTHIKIHGALSNIAAENETIARAIARAVKTVGPDLAFLAPAGTKLETAGVAQGLAVAREIFADRAYTDTGRLVERSTSGAVLHDANEAAERVLAMVLEGAIVTVSGKRLATGIDSICVHGDSPNAVAMAKAVRAQLEKAGIALAPFAAV
ncbi:MAG: LamB/YcsF family protein [Beijerinckiaceae bacterium]